MNGKRAGYLFFGISAACVLLLVASKAKGLARMANRLSFQIIPDFNRLGFDKQTQSVTVPFRVAVSNRSPERPTLRINSARVISNGRTIGDVRASQGRDLVTILPYDTTSVPVEMSFPLTQLASMGVIEPMQGAVNNLFRGGFDWKSFWSSLKDSFRDKFRQLMQQLSVRLDVEVDSVSMAEVIPIGREASSVGYLGLVARVDRPIGPLSDYAKYLPPASALKHTDPEVLYGTTGQTAELIRQLAKSHKWETAKLARSLVGRSLNDTLSRIYHFVYRYIKYEKDAPGREEVRLPLRTLYDQKGDCDCFSTLIASILENLSIPYKVRLAAYRGRPYFQHVYIIVPSKAAGPRGYYVVDPVVEGYNNEEPYSNHKDY